MKLKTGLIREVKENEKFTKKQKDIKLRHNISNENVLVVEKNNFVKFLINSFGRIIRLIATACLLVLAIIGLTALIYPTTRTGLWDIWQDTMLHVNSFF